MGLWDWKIRPIGEGETPEDVADAEIAGLEKHVEQLGEVRDAVVAGRESWDKKNDHAAKVAEIEHNEEEFEVKRALHIGNWELLWVFYPKCPNGNKVMVFCVVGVNSYDYPSKRNRINPHFGKKDSPFVRFAPTEKGWHAAIKFAEMMK